MAVLETGCMVHIPHAVLGTGTRSTQHTRNTDSESSRSQRSETPLSHTTRVTRNTHVFQCTQRGATLWRRSPRLWGSERVWIICGEWRETQMHTHDTGENRIKKRYRDTHISFCVHISIVMKIIYIYD